MRAANTGREVIVATSTESSDDALAKLIRSAGIRCYRGSLENTLERVVSALSEYEDDDLIFRLTADNVFPDGYLLDEIEKEFISRDLKYLCCNGQGSGLPYGMSVELTRLSYLRQAAEYSTSDYDREHVTPYIKRLYGEVYFDRYIKLNLGSYRCTIDCLDDYLEMIQVFDGVSEPTKIPAFELVERLKKAPLQPKQSFKQNKLVLGTAQFGMKYGVVNTSGIPDSKLVESIIKTAIVNGVCYIDTARAYENSENVISNSLKSGWEGRTKIITKLSPLDNCPVEANQLVVNAFVDASIYQSCANLYTQKLDVLMLHRARHFTDWSGAVWLRILEHKYESRIKSLGVSIQNPKELEMALDIPEIEFIQMPYNLLDWRWESMIEKIKKTKQQRSLNIHVRSALLQGLLTSNSLQNWSLANVQDPISVIDWLNENYLKFGRKNIVDLCLAFVKSMNWVDGVVVGMETKNQIHENLMIFFSQDLTYQEINNIKKTRPKLSESSLDPKFWRH